MKIIRNPKSISRQTYWLTLLLVMICLRPAVAGDRASANTASKNQAIAAIRIVDQHGRQVPSGKPDLGSQIFDVTVGPVGDEFTFRPDMINIGVGDTVRWTWASDFHSVT